MTCNTQQCECTITPLGDRVLVKLEEEKEQTSGGIIIPDAAKEKPQTAKVVAVGKGRRNSNGEREPMEVQPGQCVIISKYAGTEVKMGDQKFTLLREDDILGICN